MISEGVYALVPASDRPQPSTVAPERFTGGDDLWRGDTEGVEMNAWLHDPDGLFAAANPRVP